MLLFAITAVLGLAGLLVLYRVIKQWRRKRYVAMLRSVVMLAVLAALLSVVTMFFYSILLFKQLTYREVIATVNVHQLSDKKYDVDVVFSQDHHHENYVLIGDEWILGAQVIVWKSWMQVVGVKNKYQFDFISSRFQDAGHNRQTPLPDYSLNALDDHPVAMWMYAHAVLPYCIETIEGSAVYMPLRDKARYQVMITPSGLLAVSLFS